MTDERRILLLSSPRNHAGFESTTILGGAPEELADEFRQLQEEGFVSLERRRATGASPETPNIAISITEKGKEFLRSHGAAYVPEVPLSQLEELLKLSPEQPGDLQNVYRDRACLLVEEIATYLQEQHGGGQVREDFSQCLERLRSEVDLLFVGDAKLAHEANRERAIYTVLTLRDMLTAGKTSPKP